MARSSTYSIVACDLERREWGVAVQSRFLAIGALAAFAEAEVGAVATQSFMNTDYGHTGLRLIGEGLSARDALDRVLASDPEPEKRQVGVVDRNGTVASHTGAACMDWAGNSDELLIQHVIVPFGGLGCLLAATERERQSP